MTKGEAAAFGMTIAGPLVGFVMFVAVLLIGFSLLKDIGRA